MNKKLGHILGKPIHYKRADLSQIGAVGLYDPKGKVILVDKSLRGDAYKQCLLHEQFHCLWDRLGLNCTDIADDIQEIIVEGFSQFVIDHYSLRERRK